MNVSLGDRWETFVSEIVKHGRYGSASEVVREGLRELQEGEAAIERWLKEDVVPTLAKLDADPSRARPIDEVFDELIAELQEESKSARKRA